MITLITVAFSLFFIVLTGWTVTTSFVKKDSQKYIKTELKNLFNVGKMLFKSLKSLIEVLVKYSFSSDPSETNPSNSNGLGEQPLNVVKAVQEVESTEAQSFEVSPSEDDDTALSSFSPEVVEVITEEEEKVA